MFVWLLCLSLVGWFVHTPCERRERLLLLCTWMNCVASVVQTRTLFASECSECLIRRALSPGSHQHSNKFNSVDRCRAKTSFLHWRENYRIGMFDHCLHSFRLNWSLRRERPCRALLSQTLRQMTRPRYCEQVPNYAEPKIKTPRNTDFLFAQYFIGSTIRWETLNTINPTAVILLAMLRWFC